MTARRRINTATPQREKNSYIRHRWRRTGALLLCALLLLSTAGCKKDKPQSPEVYAISDDIAPTLDGLLAEAKEGELTAIARLDGEGKPVELPEEPAESPNPESTETPAPVAEVKQYVYTYEKLTAGGASAQSYAEMLMLEENGFVTVGEDGKPADAPDYTATEGVVILAKDSVAEGMLLQIRLDWTETGCVVAVTNPEGSLKSAAVVESMTVSEAVDFLQSQHPTRLGLEGDSMAQYEVYPREGLVMADNYICMQLAVYRKTEVGTNAVAAIYLITGDKSHIFMLDKEKNTIVELV